MHVHVRVRVRVRVHVCVCTGRLSDPNMNPAYLATLVFIGSNRKVCMPPVKDVWQRYLRKFSKAGKLLDADGLGLTDAPAPAGAPASP